MKHSISTDTLGKPTKLVVQECKQGTIPLYKQQVLNITKTKTTFENLSWFMAKAQYFDFGFVIKIHFTCWL